MNKTILESHTTFIELMLFYGSIKDLSASQMGLLVVIASQETPINVSKVINFGFRRDNCLQRKQKFDHDLLTLARKGFIILDNEAVVFENYAIEVMDSCQIALADKGKGAIEWLLKKS